VSYCLHLDEFACYSKLGEESLESWDYFCSDEMVYLGDPVGRFRNAGDVAAELYRDLKAWIHVEFVLHGQWNTCYVAIIRSALLNQTRSKVFLRETGEINEDFMSIDGDMPMFVEVAHFIQPPQRMRFIGWASDIWLKKFDFANGFGGDSFRLVTEAISAFERIDSENWELGLCGNAIEASERPNQLVERSPHVIERIPNNERQGCGQIGEFRAKDVPLVLKIILAGNSASIRGSAKDHDFPIQTLQMFVRPTQLELGIRYS